MAKNNVKYICVKGCVAGGGVLKPGDEVDKNLDPDKIARLLIMKRIAPSDSDEAKEAVSQAKKTKVKKPAPEVMPGLDEE